MSKSAYSGELPFEVLQNIFQQVENAPDSENVRNTLYQSQIVCKNWSMPAQNILYKNVSLPTDKIERFRETLLKTGLGCLVRNLKFHTDAPEFCALFPPNVEELFDEILKCSPNIETLGSTDPFFEIIIIWNGLAKVPANQHKRLKHFNLAEDWIIKDAETYVLLCLKHKHSLTKLRLGDDFSDLKNHLKEFKLLEQLQFWDTQTALCIAELDDIINNCHCTVHSLEFKKRQLVYNHNYNGQTNSNNSIKKLQFIDSTLSASSIRYLTNKLQARTTLILNSGIGNPAQLEAQEQYAEWWDQMMHFCQPLQHYSISIDDFESANYLNQISGSACMSTSIAKHAKQTHPTEFTMYLGNLKAQEKTYIIEVKQNRSCVRLFNSKLIESFEQNASIQEIFRAVQPFSPKIIRVLDVERLWDFKNVDSYLDLVFSIRSWNIFHGVISSINDNTGSVVQLDRMGFPSSQNGAEQIGQEIISNNTSISELKFTDCLLYPNTLAKMSPKLPNVDTFILDGCVFMSNSSEQLEINLPATKLGRLELNLARIFDSDSFFHPGNYHTFVLKTDTPRTTPCRYIEDSDCRNYQTIIRVPESGDSFFISIKCKEIQSLVISGVEVFNNSTD